ncbi:caffeine-induced death protein 2 [Cokeromyces recurvatus]|uniref:caffeine-induced death protein 2 n=1 Tax=Cokeromyces recurvatus TaxID=90255 RepID=UPI00222119DB|nr:caffeine-induced death protein 2 [Cokeromyces recurvatus]KAI7898134.1 caffeine-induced death protein 2 [Cokeromyces recurvatus]
MSTKRELNPTTCFNFSFFKEYMKELRKVDDNIINRLNSTSTQSEGACADFFKQISNAYAKRDEAIDYCLKLMDQDLEKKNKKLEEDPDDFDVKNSIFTRESMRQSVSNERFVEEIIRERTLQVFKTKCRSFDVTSLEK